MSGQNSKGAAPIEIDFGDIALEGLNSSAADAASVQAPTKVRQEMPRQPDGIAHEASPLHVGGFSSAETSVTQDVQLNLQDFSKPVANSVSEIPAAPELVLMPELAPAPVPTPVQPEPVQPAAQAQDEDTMLSFLEAGRVSEEMVKPSIPSPQSGEAQLEAQALADIPAAPAATPSAEIADVSKTESESSTEQNSATRGAETVYGESEKTQLLGMTKTRSTKIERPVAVEPEKIGVGLQRKWIWAAAASILIVGGVGATLFLPGFESRQATLTSPIQTTLPPKNPNLAKKSSKEGVSNNVAENSRSKGNGLSAKALGVRTFAESKNKNYFSVLEKAIVNGDIRDAIRGFRSPLNAPFDAYDKTLALEMEARYYLLAGVPIKAIQKLAPTCAADTGEHAFACVQYARALLSARKWSDAREFIWQVHEKDSYKSLASQIDLMKIFLQFFEKPSLNFARQLTENIFNELNLNPEWHRQRSVWFAAAMQTMPRTERFALMKYMLQDKREKLNGIIAYEQSLGYTSVDPLFVLYLNAQSVLFEFEPLNFERAWSAKESDLFRTVEFLEYLETAALGNFRKVSNSIQSHMSHPSFGELARLVYANIAVNEGDARIALDMYTRENALMRSGKSRFSLDWSLVAARCAVLLENPDQAKKALRELEAHMETSEPTRLDFHFWLAVAQLERIQRKIEHSGLERARALALTGWDIGLVAAEEARRLSEFGKFDDAVKLLHDKIKNVPNHGVLLQVAAEVYPRAGFDPKKVLEAQEKIPRKFLHRNLEYPIISESVLKQVLLEL